MWARVRRRLLKFLVAAVAALLVVGDASRLMREALLPFLVCVAVVLLLITLIADDADTKRARRGD